MTLRTKSRLRQWVLWLCGALVGVAVFVVLSQRLFGSVSFDVLDPVRFRLVLSIAVAFGFFAWETRWDGIRRVKPGVSAETKCVETETVVQTEEEKVRPAEESVRPLEETPVVAEPEPAPETAPEVGLSDLPEGVGAAELPSTSGEELYEQARAIPHGLIPDFEDDEEYLALLAESVEAGYAPAMAKFGDYAMRRGAWVEAYYWMNLARRNGMRGLSGVMREIRTIWSREGFPSQESNENDLFTVEEGSIGRALLHIDSGHDASSARAFLREHHPEFLLSGDGNGGRTTAT